MPLKHPVMILVDIVCVAASAAVSHFLLAAPDSIGVHSSVLRDMVVVLAVKPPVFIFLETHLAIWRYCSVRDAAVIVKGCIISSLATALFSFLFMKSDGLSNSFFLLDMILLTGIMLGIRFGSRFIHEIRSHHASVGPRTLIVGAGEAGALLMRGIASQEPPPYRVVGFVDDSGEKQGKRINGVPVLGSTSELKEIIRKHFVEKVIISAPSEQSKIIRKVKKICSNSDVTFKTVPPLKDIISGKPLVSQIKDIEIDDLLGRDPVVLDETAISKFLSGKKVLVTGAAGSIGSEICRQVARFKPANLILIDIAETPLFFIERELRASFPKLKVTPGLVDVRNEARINSFFAQHQPDVVFHAAAYKHVPMMEENPSEAVTNNVWGTRIVADAAHRAKVAAFVLVSTDKAVRPTNVMGATKRAAEIYVQSLAGRSFTSFITVRFGNVLGSNGSVIPIFKEQIRKGGPITVTDPNVTRYFMTIPEATQLVLQAGCLGNGGEIFVLDMGKPVRILDLAEELIRLSGYTPHKDIEISFTGLRPGEKLSEELLLDGEGVVPTRHRKIRVLSAVTYPTSTAQLFDGLFRAAERDDVPHVVTLLRKLVPEFTPSPRLQQVKPLQKGKLELVPPSRQASAGSSTLYN